MNELNVLGATDKKTKALKEKYNVIFFSIDGEYQKEKEFDTIEEAGRYINNIGSRWFFYPFPYIVKGNKIVESCDYIYLNGDTIEEAQKIIKKSFK